MRNIQEIKKNKHRANKTGLIEWIRHTLTWSEYESLPQILGGISKSRFTRIEKTGIMYYEELRYLLSFIYRKFADSALIKEPEALVLMFKQTHISMSELQELTRDYIKIRREQEQNKEEELP